MLNQNLLILILGVTGFFIRLVLLGVAGFMLTDFIDFSITKDFFSGKFPPDADSTGIPIFGAQLLIFGGLILSSPIALLGIGSLRTWFFKRSLFLTVILLLIFMFCYLMLFFISLSGLEGLTNEAYRERWFDGVALFVLAVLFLSLDVTRFILSKTSKNRLVNNRVLNWIPC